MIAKANTQTMTLGIDLDNTVARFTCSMREFVARTSGITDADEIARILPDPQTYDLDPWNWEETAYAGFMDAFRTAERAGGLYSGMKAHTGAANALRTIQDAGHRLVVITARDAQWEGETTAALSRWGLSVDKMIFSNDKHLHSTVLGGDIDCFIDDSPGHLAKFDNHGIDTIAFHNTYNADSEATARIRRWDQAPALFGL